MGCIHHIKDTSSAVLSDVDMQQSQSTTVVTDKPWIIKFFKHGLGINSVIPKDKNKIWKLSDYKHTSKLPNSNICGDCMTERSITLLIYTAINSIQLLKFLRGRSTNQSCGTATNRIANFVHESMVWHTIYNLSAVMRNGSGQLWERLRSPGISHLVPMFHKNLLPPPSG